MKIFFPHTIDYIILLTGMVSVFMLIASAGALAQEAEITPSVQETMAEEEIYSVPMITGQRLVDLCQADESPAIRQCDTYIKAVIDYHNLIKGLGNPPSIDFCLTPRANPDSIREMVTRYIIANPEHNDFIAAPGVVSALNIAYPCD